MNRAIQFIQPSVIVYSNHQHITVYVINDIWKGVAKSKHNIFETMRRDVDFCENIMFNTLEYILASEWLKTN